MSWSRRTRGRWGGTGSWRGSAPAAWARCIRGVRPAGGRQVPWYVPAAVTPPWRGTVFRLPAGTLGGVVHKRSAGILLFRRAGGPDGELQVLLGHMGGPFWARRDAGAWSVVKGEYEPDETPQAAARREFQEELGLPVPDGELLPLGEARQTSGKVVTAWALEGDLDPERVVPGT